MSWTRRTHIQQQYGRSSSSIRVATLDSELSGGVDGAMFVLSHTLVHAGVHQSEAADLQAGAAHFNPVLKTFSREKSRRGRKNKSQLQVSRGYEDVKEKNNSAVRRLKI